ncbi:methyl-accepting chemotaxis protein [Rummeliibacillus sp. JY-2-4R]
MKKILNWKLRTKLISSFLVILIIPSLILGGIAFYSTTIQIEKEQVNSAKSSINLLNSSITNTIDPKVHDAQYFSKRITSSLLISSKNSELRKILDQYVNEHPEAAMAYVGTAHGEMIRMPFYQYPKDYDPRERPWYQEAMQKNGEVVITEPYVSSTSGNLVITISKKLADGSGVIGIDISIDTLRSITNKIKIGQNGFISLVDNNGVYISHPNKKSGSPANESYIKKVMANSMGQMTNKKHEILYMTNNSTGWKVIGSTDKSEATKASLPMLYTNMIVQIIFFIIGGIVISLIVRSIIKPIDRLKNSAQKVSDGDLTEDIVVNSNDEIGELSKSFIDMKDKLSTLISKVNNSTTLVRSSSEELSASASQNIAASQQIAAAMQQVTIGTENQTVGIEQNAVSVEEVSIGITAIAEDASQVSNLSVQATQQAEEGGKSIQHTVSQMDSIHQSVTQSDTKIKSLYDRTKEIGAILDIIGDIADQTNLLALNASIEAARAGEHGKGFAVVADEVRKLAEGSRESASKIASLITSVQQDSGEAVKIMGQTLENVKKGITISQSTATKFEAIIESMRDITPKIENVSATSEQISASIQEIAATAINLNDHAKDNAAASEEVTASTEETLSSMESMELAAGQLLNMAEELQQIVQQFKIQ